MNDVPISCSRKRLSAASKWISTCTSGSCKKSRIFPKAFTTRLDADFGYMLQKGRMRSRHWTKRKDVGTRIGPTQVSMTLSIGVSIFDMVITHMCTLRYSFWSIKLRCSRWKFIFSVFFAWRGRAVATAGSGPSGQSFKVLWSCIEWCLRVRTGCHGFNHLIYLGL